MLNHSNHEIFDWNPSYCDAVWQEINQLRTEASTRKFWRCRSVNETFVLMYSPPETEQNDRFIQFAEMFKHYGVPVPTIYDHDLDNGYFLLEDVGVEDFHTHYELRNVDYCMALAFRCLRNIQSISEPIIPPYEKERFVQELGIFRDNLCFNLIEVNTDVVQSYFEHIVEEISALPKVTVHRDYHCKNLLIRADPPFLGVVDFQDALVGPITYDLASLLYDCYWDHEHATIEKQIEIFWSQSLAMQHREAFTHREFSVALKLTALQRLLKAAGIFVRLWLQRKQATHLKYVLPTLRKAQDICEEIEAVRPIGLWLQREVIPVTLLEIRRQN